MQMRVATQPCIACCRAAKEVIPQWHRREHAWAGSLLEKGNSLMCLKANSKEPVAIFWESALNWKSSCEKYPSELLIVILEQGMPPMDGSEKHTFPGFRC